MNCDCDLSGPYPGLCSVHEEEQERGARYRYHASHCDEDDCPPHEAEDCNHEHPPLGVHVR